MTELIDVTENNIYKAFQLQHIRDEIGWDPNRPPVSWLRRAGKFTPAKIALGVLYPIAQMLEEKVNAWADNEFLGRSFKDGNLSFFISKQKLADQLCISVRGTAYHLQKLQRLGILQNDGSVNFGHIKMPIRVAGRWKYHPRLPMRSCVWFLDVATGCYTGEHDSAYLDRYNAILDAQEDDTYREASLF